jgi:prefoldin beta subunit
MAKDNCGCGHDHESCDESCQNEQHSMDELDEETQRKIQELQILEQNFQQLLMQKQAFKYEFDETNFALDEIKEAEGDIFRVVAGSIMIKSTKAKVEEELKHKKELIELRMKNIDKQEAEFSKRIESIREEVLKTISNKD